MLNAISYFRGVGHDFGRIDVSCSDTDVAILALGLSVVKGQLVTLDAFTDTAFGLRHVYHRGESGAWIRRVEKTPSMGPFSIVSASPEAMRVIETELNRAREKGSVIGIELVSKLLPSER